MNNGATVQEAIAAIEGLDSDLDPGAHTNLEEILADTQPGWTPGAHNTIFNGGEVGGQEPATGILGDLDPVTTTTTLAVTTTTLAVTTTTLPTTTTTLPTTTTTLLVSTTTVSSTTTTTTLGGGLVPGGPVNKGSSDCYLELLVEGIANLPPQVEEGKKIVCTDGDACDLGPCGDDICTMRAGICINQTDPNLPECSPPAGLEKLTIKNKLSIQVPQLLEGPVCGAIVEFTVEAKFNKKGKYQAAKSKQSVRGKAKAPKGTSPRSDSDKWSIQCQPREGACPGSVSSAFLE